MGLGVGIFLIAVGAILTFAVNATSSSVDIDAVGWILMGVGLAERPALAAVLAVMGWAGLLEPAPDDLRRRRPAGTADERENETASGPSRCICG